MSSPTVKVGQFTGNGASNIINLGFTPDYIKAMNLTDGTVAWEAWRAGSNGTGYTTVGSSNGSTGSFLQPVAQGIGGVSFLDGVTTVQGRTSAPGTVKGFRVGSTLSTNTKIFAYLAVRSGDGLQGDN